MRVCTSRPSAQTQPLLTSIYILRWCKDFAIFCFQWARYIRMIYTDIYIHQCRTRIRYRNTQTRARRSRWRARMGAGAGSEGDAASPEAGRGSGGEVYIQTGYIYIYIDTRTPPPLNIAPVDASALLARARADCGRRASSDASGRLRTQCPKVFGPGQRLRTLHRLRTVGVFGHAQGVFGRPCVARLSSDSWRIVAGAGRIYTYTDVIYSHGHICACGCVHHIL